MFDGSLPETADLASLDDAALVDAVGGWVRAENAACARKVAAMAELFCRRTGLEDAGDRDMWWVDPDAAVSAEIGAAAGITAGLALSQTHRGVALHDRLPSIAALFEQGVVGDLLVRTIVWRTALIESAGAMARVDRALAGRVTRWGALGQKKTEQAIDELVDDIDPAALRRSRASGSSRGVQFGSPADEPGFMTMWARVYATDGVAIQARVNELAHSVCDADPRTSDERRADAIKAAMNHTALACHCEQDTCPRRHRRNTGQDRRGLCRRRREIRRRGDTGQKASRRRVGSQHTFRSVCSPAGLPVRRGDHAHRIVGRDPRTRPYS